MLDNLTDWLNEQTLITKLGIFVGLIVIISGVYWYFFWSPNNQQLTSLNSELQTKRKKLTELENIKKDFTKFIAENERLEKEFKIASLKLRPVPQTMWLCASPRISPDIPLLRPGRRVKP